MTIGDQQLRIQFASPAIIRPFHRPGHSQGKCPPGAELANNLRRTRRLIEEEVWHFPDGTSRRYRTDRPTESDLATRRGVEQEFGILRARTRVNPDLIIGGRSPQGPEGTLDAHIARSFIEHPDRPAVRSGKPQFHHLGFHFPHTPVLPPREFRDRFKNRAYKVPPFDKDRELLQLPPQLRKLYEKMQIDGLAPAEMQQAIRDYYAFCAYGDSLIGRCVAAFRKSAEARQRPWLVLIVCGDHGWHLGENGIEAKFGPYDISNRCTVIAVASDPARFPAGTVHDGFVEFVPTLLAGADLGAPALDHLDGRIECRWSEENTYTRSDFALGADDKTLPPLRLAR